MKLLVNFFYWVSGSVVILMLEGFLPGLKPLLPFRQEPRMEIEDVTTRAMTVLMIRDTAATAADIGPTLARNYSEIDALIKNNKLKYGGMPMAWYHSSSAPFVLEAGIPVDKSTASVAGRVQLKQVPESKAVVVHFWGPYELTERAYPLIQEWLKQRNKTAVGAPYDVYVTDPTTVKDAYQVQTDIHQPYK